LHSVSTTDSIRAADILSLRELLAAPVKAATLSTWAGESPSRHAFLASTVWCTISWPKQLGVPRGASFASGFIVTHEYWDRDLVDGPSGPMPGHPRWRRPPIDAVVSGSAEDETRYWTSILMHPFVPWANRLRVELVDNAWDPLPILAGSGPHSYRSVQPAEQQFLHDGSDYSRPYLLHDVDVVARDVWTF
jgi:hypothetical protein